MPDRPPDDADGPDSRRWAVICRSFHALRTLSARHGLQGEWVAAVDGTQRGEQNLDVWMALRAELVRRAACDPEVIRHPGVVPGGGMWKQPAVTGGYACPINRCDRSAGRDRITGEPPVCELTGVDMRPVAGGR